MKNVVFIANKTKASALSIAERLVGYAESAGFSCEVFSGFPVEREAFEGRDICCVIGGDGTILSCVPSLVKNSLPIFGINLGKLGFLANYTDGISRENFLELISGGGIMHERALLRADINGSEHLALNDFVMKDSRAAGISSFRIFSDSEFVADYVGDGLIFSTPTGATAYNLSAGGPLIHPDMRAFVMTPVCPHTLTNRSLIFNDASSVRIKCLGGRSTLLADGMEITGLEAGDEFEIRMPPQTMKFVCLKGHSNFGILRNKLGWAEDPRRHVK